MSEKKSNLIYGIPDWTFCIAPIALLLALLDWSYSYYQILKIICFVTFLFLGVKEYSLSKGFSITFFVLATIFNPLIPIKFNRETWAFIDISVVIFYFVGYFMKKHKSNTILVTGICSLIILFTAGVVMEFEEKEKRNLKEKNEAILALEETERIEVAKKVLIEGADLFLYPTYPGSSYSKLTGRIRIANNNNHDIGSFQLKCWFLSSAEELLAVESLGIHYRINANSTEEIKLHDLPGDISTSVAGIDVAKTKLLITEAKLVKSNETFNLADIESMKRAVSPNRIVK